MRVIFMGTPQFAVSMMEAIHLSEHELVGVVTVPDKPAGRGKKLRASAVKERAMELDVPVLQPLKLRDPQFIESLKLLKADVFVVVAFRMLPEIVWRLPSYGTFNLHASLLPQYRGAAPINWAIVNGESETGLSTFFIDDKIDTGAVIDQASLAIGQNENAGELHDRMMVLGSTLVVKTLAAIKDGSAKPKEQASNGDLKIAPKIFKETLKIDPCGEAQAIHNLIRGMSPFPGAWARINIKGEQKTLKIYESKLSSKQSGLGCGALYKEEKKLFMATKNFDLEIISLQPEGKKRLKASDFLNGHEIDENTMIY
jgi:methionyl-tRNA formyltransferase